MFPVSNQMLHFFPSAKSRFQYIMVSIVAKQYNETNFLWKGNRWKRATKRYSKYESQSFVGIEKAVPGIKNICNGWKVTVQTKFIFIKD